MLRMSRSRPRHRVRDRAAVPHLGWWNAVAHLLRDRIGWDRDRLLVTAVHSCGLVALTHALSPMGFLNKILGRPSHEKPFVLLVVDHPANNARVPDISRKDLSEISSFVTQR
jgi:hypothetical protein